MLDVEEDGADMSLGGDEGAFLAFCCGEKKGLRCQKRVGMLALTPVAWQGLGHGMGMEVFWRTASLSSVSEIPVPWVWRGKSRLCPSLWGVFSRVEISFRNAHPPEDSLAKRYHLSHIYHMQSQAPSDLFDLPYLPVGRGCGLHACPKVHGLEKAPNAAVSKGHWRDSEVTGTLG